MLTPGSENKKIIELLIVVARLRSQVLIDSVTEHYVDGMSVPECAIKYDIDKANLYRVKRDIEHINEVYEKIMRVRCGL